MSRWGRGGIRVGGCALLAGALIAAVPGLDSRAFAGTTTTAHSAPSTVPATTTVPTTSPTPTTASAPAAAVSHAAKPALALGPTSLNFGHQRAGTVSFAANATIKNFGRDPITLENMNFTSGNATDFVVGTTCFPNGKPRSLTHGQTCLLEVRFVPRGAGYRKVDVRIFYDGSGSPQILTLTGTGTEGYYIAAAGGGVATFGDAVSRGDRRQFSLAAPIIGMTTTHAGSGYWLLGSDGGVFSFGKAHFYGSTGAMRLNQPVVGMASLPNGSGYWLVAADGGIFSFGNAKFYGSTGGIRLNQPIVGMAVTRTGNGYWLVAADGGVFTFGDAKFFGSVPGVAANQQATAMAATPTGSGYWILSRDGAVYTFGDAIAMKSVAGRGRGAFVGISPTPNSRGYWLSTSVGEVFALGNAPYYGDLFRGRGVAGAAGVVGSAPPLPPKRIAPGRGVINAANTGMLRARIAAEANARVTSG